jgi:hypothetical protein
VDLARDTPTPFARTYGIPIACASVSPTEKPPIVYSPATRPHGTQTGSYVRSSPAAFAPAVRPWAYACDPVRPRIGIIVSPCGTSMTSPAAHTPSRGVRMWSSTMSPPVVPVGSPAACASAVFGTLCRQTITASHSSSPSEVCTARTEPSPRNASTAVPRCSCTPRSVRDVWTGSATSGSRTSCSTHGPSSTKCVSRPRWPRLPAISTPSGVAPTTTIRFIESRSLSNSIALRMFLT